MSERSGEAVDFGEIRENAEYRIRLEHLKLRARITALRAGLPAPFPELRYNKNHDSETGRFTSGRGGTSAGAGKSSGKGLTGGGESGSIKSSTGAEEPSIAQKIASGEYSTKLSKQQFAKHTPGTAQYEQYKASRMKQGRDPQSIVTVSAEEAQRLITRYAGKGDRKISNSGKSLQIEFVTADQVVGQYYSNGAYYNTRRMAIHYGKQNAHIVPVEEDVYG